MDAGTLTLRTAEAGDFNEIVKLSEGIYTGHDYLPLIFHQWLQRDNIVVILAHCGARLVGLEAYFVVDDGRTLIHRAGRVHPDYRGQGIFKQIYEYSIKHTKEHYPNLQRERFTSILDLEIPDPRKLLELHVEAYHVGKEFCDKSEATALKNPMEIKTCAPDYFANIIESLPARLFASNSIFLSNSCPFDRLRSNVDHILRESTELYVEKCDHDVIPNSLGVGTLSPRVKYMQWVAQVYTDSPDLFQAHIVHQFKRACELINDDFVFITMADERLSSLVRIIMKDQLKFKTVDRFHNKTLKVFEKDLNVKSHL